MSTELDVRESGEAVAAEAAAILLAHARPGAHIALAGGSTPKRAYAAAAEADHDWSGVTLWLSDERVVGPGDERSNGRMAREQLVNRLPSDRRPAFEAVDTGSGADAAAEDYEKRLRDALGSDGRFDLVLLGLGPDSHTASLFPGKPAVEERARWVAPVPEPGMEPRVPRVTFTLPLLAAAAEVLFLVAGEDKAPAMVRAFGEPPDPTSPAAHVAPAAGRMRILCDAASAAGLRNAPNA